LGFEEKRVLSNKVRNNGHFIEGKQFLFDMQNGMNFMRKKIFFTFLLWRILRIISGK